MKKAIGLKFRLDDLKTVICKWLHLEDTTMIDVVCGTYIANKFNSDPLWMNIIGPPSSTKTEILRAFDGHKSAKFISNLTPSTLVSGIIPKKGKPDPSLLPQLNDKLVVLKDFTTVLSMRSENQAEILAQLREAYDGQYSKLFGNGKEINWTGRFGLIAACTPVYDAHYAVISSMGDRFLLFRTGHTDGGRMGLQAQKIVGQEDEMRAEIRAALHRFIDQFESIENLQFKKDETVNLKIVNLACFVAYGRCAIMRDYRNQCVTYQPIPEGTPRLVKQLMQIGLGISLAHGKNCIDEDVYEYVKKIACDLVPVQRLNLIRFLWESKAFEFLDSWVQTKDVADGVNMPSTTTKIALEDLMITGTLNRQLGESDSGRPPYLWQLTDQVGEWMTATDLFEGTFNKEYT